MPTVELFNETNAWEMYYKSTITNCNTDTQLSTGII